VSIRLQRCLALKSTGFSLEHVGAVLGEKDHHVDGAGATLACTIQHGSLTNMLYGYRQNSKTFGDAQHMKRPSVATTRRTSSKSNTPSKGTINQMIGEPKLDDRDAQPYVGIRTLASLAQLPEAIPGNHRKVYAWLKEHGVSPSGPPFIRYRVINMETKLDIELGVPVAHPVTASGGVSADALPAGRYASVVYTGPYAGDGLMRANAALLDWGADKGLEWDRFDDPNGDGFGSRYESYITDPGEEPDPMKWMTEVAIRVADR